MDKIVAQKIAELTALKNQVDEIGNIPFTFAGSTHEMYAEVSEIKVTPTGRFVTLVGPRGHYQFLDGALRFNVANKDKFADFGRKDFLYYVNILIRAYKKAL